MDLNSYLVGITIWLLYAGYGLWGLLVLVIASGLRRSAERFANGQRIDLWILTVVYICAEIVIRFLPEPYRENFGFGRERWIVKVVFLCILFLLDLRYIRRLPRFRSEHDPTPLQVA